MAAAANNAPPPGPFAADDTKPFPAGWLPPDLWYHISGFVASDQASDFVVTTAQSVDDHKEMPLRALRQDNDLVLRGVPANGVLYITEVPERSQHGLHETYNFRTKSLVDDLGPWFAKIHRHVDGRIDLDRTPLCWPGNNNFVGPVEHSFFVEATAPHAVRLSVSEAELDVVAEWHATDELRPAKSRETRSMRQRLVQRHGNMQTNADTYLLKISGGSTKACNGKLTMLALCKALKIKAKLGILGRLPLMARLDPDNPVDELSQMTHPYNLAPQMSYNLGKWLMLVPSKWIICTQNIRQCVLTHNEFASGGIPSIQRIREWIWDNPGHASATFGHTWCFLNRMPTRQLMFQQPNNRGALLKYACTSFQTLAPLMVYAFFSCANRFVSLTSDKETQRLITLAQEDSGFRQEFSVTGPHVTPAGPGEHLTAGKSGVAAAADTSPELELLGGFNGIF